MKLVSAVVAPQRIEAVHLALRRFGVQGLTISEVLTLAPRRHWEIYRGHPYPVDLLRHGRIEVITTDGDAADLMRIIRVASQSGACSVWVTPVETLLRVRTGERGTEAL